MRQAHLRHKEVFVPLAHLPGDAQADFGEALGFPTPMPPASERLQSLATANRLLTATTKTAPPRKSTRFPMIRVTNSPM